MKTSSQPAASSASRWPSVVTKLDRLGRSLEHLMALSKQLQASRSTSSCSTRASTRRRRLAGCSFHILGAIAEFEHALMMIG